MSNDEIVELREDVSQSPLYSEDLAPVPAEERTWSMWHLASLWVGMAVCIPTYLLASYMIGGGMSWIESLIIIGLANLIVTIPMVLNGHAGVKYGIPFPVLGRASFGTAGIHLASLVRAIVACGWFGIQTWIGGLAIYAIYAALTGGTVGTDLSLGKFICFAVFWLLNMFFIWKGTESIKFLEQYSAPILILMGLVLIGWGAKQAGGFGIVLQQSQQLQQPGAEYFEQQGKNFLQINPITDKQGKAKATQYRLISGKEEGPWQAIARGPVQIPAGISTENLQLQVRKQSTDASSSRVAVQKRSDEVAGLSSRLWSYVLWLTVMVGFWATMSLSISDITRYAASQKAQVMGQFIGLPGTMMLYSFVAIFVTCAALINFDDILIANDAPWDPVSLISKFKNPAIVIIAQVFMIIATLSTNIAANVIAPSNAFSNLWPQKITFAGGGLITGLLGIASCPWWLMDSISSILIFISGLLGPVLGVMLSDYFLVRKKKLQLAELFKSDGAYSYSGGFNPAAMIALALGVLVAIIGFFVPALAWLYTLSWFSGFAVSFVLYWILMRGKVAEQQLVAAS